MRTKRDCVVIGGGPAGMAAAIALRKLGVEEILLIERNDALGGILSQCIHVGFGLSYFGENYTGPEYAAALSRAFLASGASFLLGAMVLEISPSRVVKVLSRSEGYLEIEAGAIVIATGCRERTRDNLEIPGTRPAGVFTAGQAQALVNLKSFRIGTKVLIQGSGDIGLIMARRLAIEGCEVLGVLERLPYLSGLVRNKVQCLDHFDIPLSLSSQVCEIVGRRRIEGVYIERLDASFQPIPGSREFRACDTLLFSVGLIPEVDILQSAGLSPERGGSVAVNSSFETEAVGVFLAGNACHIHDLADGASREGEAVAAKVEAFLRRPAEFAASTTRERPFKPLETTSAFDEAFFERLAREGAKVCIVCPRGCVVSAMGATCPRGAAYFAESAQGRRQILTTSIQVIRNGRRARLPLRSLEIVDVRDIPAIKARLPCADLGGADLGGAEIGGADLGGAEIVAHLGTGAVRFSASEGGLR